MCELVRDERDFGAATHTLAHAAALRDVDAAMSRWGTTSAAMALVMLAWGVFLVSAPAAAAAA